MFNGTRQRGVVYQMMKRKSLSSAAKFAQLKKQTEDAGMRVSVRGNKVVVGRRKKK